MFIDYIIINKVAEAENIFSLYLQRTDGQPLAPFFAGQYLQFEIQTQSKPVIRNYTLSDSPGKNFYRITVKKDEMGIGSVALVSYAVGDTLRGSTEPKGAFFLLEVPVKPLVLLSAGVGITPMISILNRLLEENYSAELWFIHAAKGPEHQIMRPYLEGLETKHPNLHLHFFLTQATVPDARANRGRVRIEFLKERLGGFNYSFYLCGPNSFIDDFRQDLQQWGVPHDEIFFERFNAGDTVIDTEAANGLEVHFSKSDKKTYWDTSFTSLLELAEKSDVKIESSCRMGSCLSCESLLLKGTVSYHFEPFVEVRDKHILMCSARPASNLIIEL